MASASSTTPVSNEERRWVVIGVCLTKVLTPALRNVLATEMPKWHQVLCQPPTEIDKQVFGRHQKKLYPSTVNLNYKSINNNDVIGSHRAFDYAVKDPLSLAKLFVQPFMSKFTGFDVTMDTSAVLSVICEAAPFVGAAAHAKTVRSDIRNEWAHCNFAEWTEPKFLDSFQNMESLLKNVHLSPNDEQKLCDELNSWKMKGLELCFGQVGQGQQSPESRIKTVIETVGEQEERNVEINRGLRKKSREVEESYEDDLSSSDGEDSIYKFVDFYKCQHASCGYDALLYMLYKMKIEVCAFKLLQMIGAVASKKGPSCTRILQNVKDEKGHFLKKIYKHGGIVEGKQQEVLKEAEAIFNDSKQKAGILSYQTDLYNHCVNIYKSKSGKIKILDVNDGKTYIEHLYQVRYLEVVVLDCDETGVPKIIKRWHKCLTRNCENEVISRSRPGNIATAQ